MEPVTLELIAHELGHIRATVDALAAKQAPSSIVVTTIGAPYQRRPLMLSEIDPALIDGESVLGDGSTWWINNAGVPEGRIYGYISREKDPAMWDQMLAAFGGDEDHLMATLGIAHEPYLRWKVDPRVLIASTKDLPTLRFQLAQMLSSPLPPMRPTVA